MMNGPESTYRQFIDAYLEHAGQAKSQRAYELISEIVPRILSSCGWPPHSEELLRYWQKRISRGQIKRVTANRECRAVGAALGWGVRQGYLEENACAAIRRWREGDRGSPIFFEPEEVADILAHLPEKYHGLINWSIWTGMRVSESLALTWEDMVSTEGDRWHAVRIRTRGGEERIIPLIDECGWVLAQASRQNLPRPFPFRSRRAVYQVWTRAKNRAGITKGHFYTLRATCAVWFLRSGASLEEVSQILGHSSITVTEQIFGAFVHDDLELDAGQPEGERPPWQAEQILRESGRNAEG